MTETDVVSLLPELEVPPARGTKQIQSSSACVDGHGSHRMPKQGD